VAKDQPSGLQASWKQRADPIPAKIKRTAARFYQLKSGHALIGTHLKRISSRPSDNCWWCYPSGDCGVQQTREHLLENCSRWKDAQRLLWSGILSVTGRKRRPMAIRQIFTDERSSEAIISFLKATDVGS
jgi:hypothetical protein